MKPNEIRALRTKHNLTRSHFGKLVYQTERAVIAWELGQRNIPPALVELLLWKLEGIIPPRPTWTSEDQLELL